MAALFACTKCHSRHPFDDLSASEQLCKKCRNYQPVVKCTLCRAEFNPGEKGSTNNNCRHCTHNVKVYGEPNVCRFCNLMAAFVDRKCQRCTAYQKKHGDPLPCEQCKMKAAFDKSEKNRKKVDGKTLCWLCTLAYRRVLIKARQRQEEKKQSLRSNPSSYDKLDKLDVKPPEKPENMSTGSNSRDKISPFENNSQSQSSKTPQKDNKSLINLSVGDKSTPPSFASSFDFLREHKEEKSNDSSDVKMKEEPKEEPHKHRHHHHHHHHKKHKRRSHSPRSPSKRPRIENSDSNGVGTPNKTSLLATEKSPIDPNSSEHIIAINRLQEQLESLKKQLGMKDQQLLEKEKKMTEIKAAQYESEKLSRNKILDLTKMKSEGMETLQAKNRELEKKNRDLTKQVQQLSKGKKGSLLLAQNNSNNNSPNISS